MGEGKGQAGWDPFQRYAFISLGANLPSGNDTPARTLRLAFAELERLSDAPLLRSSLWASTPLDCPPGSPPYINAVAGLFPRSGEQALSLLHQLQAIESRFGRTRSGLRNEARVLDLDLITFRGEGHDTPELILPHPRAAQRKFVLAPLREVTGDWALPGEALGIDGLLAGLHDQEITRLAE